MGRFEQVRANIRRAYGLTRAMRAARNGAVPDGANPGRANPGRVNSGRVNSGRASLDEHPIEMVRASAPAPAHPSVISRDDEDVPRGLRLAAAWSWRLLVIAAAAAAVLWVIGRLQLVLIPLSIALLLSALFSPVVGWLRRRVRLPRTLATAVVLIGGLAVVIGTLTAVITQFVTGLPDLSKKTGDGVRQIQNWLQTGPLHLSNKQLDDAVAAGQKWLTEHRTSGALTTAATAIDVLAALFLVLFATFFFLRDGRRIWRFIVGLFPAGAREHLASAGEQSWQTLVAYVRATVLVAFIDAVGIGLALVILRVQFAFPLAALVFLAAFVPIVGATVSGSVAVLVALVTRGPLTALLLLGAVIAIQQLEGHVLQPVIMGRAVAIHPLAVIVAIATGVVLAGIIGALVAVPLVAVINTGIRHLIERRREPPPEAVIISSR